MPIINVHNYRTRIEAIQLVSNLDLTKVHHVKVTCKRGKRSIDANALYWMWLNCISDETGNDKDDLHHFFKDKYLGIKRVVIFGDEFAKKLSTTDLDSKQFSQYLNKIQVFAASELSIKLPNPEDLKFEQFKEHYSKMI